jgi:hypothetical protein
VLAALLVSPARAQDAPARRSGFKTNDYAIDLFTGPVLGGGRIVGMSGAYGAIATSIEGSMWNPAGYAERAEEELDFWEWDLTGSLGLGGLFARNDVDNNGQRNDLVTDYMWQYTLGGRLQFANSGSGATIVGQIYELTDESGAAASIEITNARVGTGYAFLRGSLVVGGALRFVTMDISDPRENINSKLIGFSGTGVELGVLIRPAYERYRIGLVGRSPVASKPDPKANVDQVDGLAAVRGFVLPEMVHVPWELDLGFAYQFGERRSNVPWRATWALKQQLKQQLDTGTYAPPMTHGGKAYPPMPSEPRAALRQAVRDELESQRRYLRSQPRRYILLSGDVLLFGTTELGHGVAAFLTQRPEPSGRKTSVGVRVGTEGELLQNRLKVRAGSYLEPSRFGRNRYRVHATFGSDVRLFDVWSWSIRGTATLDVAPRYFDWGLAIGFWY